MMQVDPVIILTNHGKFIYKDKIISLFRKTKVFEDFEIHWLEEQLDVNNIDYHWAIYLFCNEVIGAACFGPIMKERPGRFDLYWIAVDPEKHGIGIGKKLLARVEEEAKKIGATHMYIETGSWNSHANLLYGGAGYKLMGIIEQYYNDTQHKHVWGKRL